MCEVRDRNGVKRHAWCLNDKMPCVILPFCFFGKEGFLKRQEQGEAARFMLVID